METSPLKRKLSTGHPLGGSDLPSYNRKTGAAYLTSVSNLVTTFRHERFVLENPVGATLIVGPLEDTIYSDDEVNGWGKFYLPQTVNMRVVGVVEGTSCPCDQLVLMTCEDKNIYAYNGEELHLVASSLDKLFSDGIEFPASKTFYKGEAFKDVTKEDWAEVRKGPVGRKLDKEHQKWVKANKSRILKNLRLGRDKQRCHQQLGGGPLDDNMLRTLSTHQSAYTV
uniref:US22 family protein n=1 Tax=Amphiprion percula TaxID=161767 RepID=A0A3P8RRL7_AMPPE